MRPSSSSPTGISSRRFVRLTVSPSEMCSHGPNSTAPTLSDSRLSARPITSCGQLEHLEGHAVLEAVDAGDAVADREDGADLGQVGLTGVEALDAGLEDGGDLVGLDLHEWLLRGCASRPGRLACEVVRGGCGSRRPGSSCRPGRRGRRGCRARPSTERSTLRPVCSAMRSPIWLTVALSSSTAEVTWTGSSLFSSQPQLVEPAPDAEDHRHPVVLDQQLEEVDEDRVGVGDRAIEPVLLLGGREVGREEEHLQLAGLVERVGELRRAARGSSRACPAPSRPRRANGRRPRRSPP